MNADELRKVEHSRWSRVAAGWYKHDATLTSNGTPVSEKMIELARLKPGSKVLDLASGTGEPALAVAERVGPTGRVIGTDLVEDMLVFARKKAAARGLTHIEFQCVGAEAADFEAGSFDAVTMRWGIMFVPEPRESLTRVRRMLKPGGRIVLATWTQPEQNPFLAMPAGVVARTAGLKPPPPDAPNVFRFTSSEKLEQVLKEAGFVDVESTTVDASWGPYETGKDFWNFTLELAGPLIQIIESLPEEKRLQIADEVAQQAERFRTPSGILLPSKSWVVVARTEAG